MMLRLIYIISFFILNCLISTVVNAMRNEAVPGNPVIETVAFTDEQGLEQAIQKILKSWHKKGFLNATIDSVVKSDSVTQVYLSKGDEYFYKLSNEVNSDNDIRSGVPEIPVSEEITFNSFNYLIENILTHYGNNGYPFARVSQENVIIEGNIINLNLQINQGELIVFDTIHLSGNARLSRNFLANLLGIKEGQVFNEELVRSSVQKLSVLEYIRISAPLQLYFTPGRAMVILPALKNNSNRFDIIAGLSGGDGENIPVRINGSVMLFLSNVLGNGESFSMSWKGPGAGTQILDINGSYPFPFNLPLETEILFSLHRQDTSWIQLQFKPVVLFNIKNNSKLGVFWHLSANSLISTLKNREDLQTPFSDYTLNAYGLEYRYSTIAFGRQLQQSGFFSKAIVAAGNRKINEKAHGTGVDLTRKSHFNFQTHFEIRKSTGKRTTLSIEGFSGFQSGQNLPVNQLYRLGGFRILKGFDELSLYASSYAITNIEFRLFTGTSSYFNLFANGGWLEHKGFSGYFNQWPVGFGTGLNLQTQAGIFSINIAMGWHQDQSAEFRNAKVHFGYISKF